MTPTPIVPVAAQPAWAALGKALSDVVPPCCDAPDHWYSNDPGEQQQAAQACSKCSVFILCGEYATAAAEDHGIWAGIRRDPPRTTGVRRD